MLVNFHSLRTRLLPNLVAGKVLSDFKAPPFNLVKDIGITTSSMDTMSHDPAISSTTEPTTGRVLNILDIPVESSSRSSKSSSSSSKHSSSSSSKHSSHSSSRRESRRDSHLSVDIPKGRPLSISQIKSPKPMSPHATKHILEADYAGPTVDELTARFGVATMEEYDYDYDLPGSPSSSVGSTISDTSGTSSPSSASSMSDYSSGSNTSACTCERYGITRKGDRIKLDCGGSRCGYSDSESCSSEDEVEYSRSSRRNGIVVRR
ncbi:d1c98005-7176-4a75-a199-b2117ca27dbf-CDS [Sclerotinia trifoliorum]|uniref:D1c98005-7176-4a75-a199-b2117ca27dbf-CDS n=1 Tax=Sclerotinia trifoliorum TaxID=28548 RepID=A0A8H2ZV13_9HELO|nr:d1c98005-7176-4a75-a199-b2117ca27dbf-CDS [Sclerotinia trifoliorum]